MADVAERKRPAQPGELDPYSDGIAYLKAKGWRCLGNPEWPTAKWLDPTQPLVAHYTEEPIYYDHEVREEYYQDGQRKIRYRMEKRQILAQDGSAGALVAAKRFVFHPKVTPVDMQHALSVQLERDAAEQLARERERAKAEWRDKPGV